MNSVHEMPPNSFVRIMAARVATAPLKITRDVARDCYPIPTRVPALDAPAQHGSGDECPCD
jgi:hypothetical protein